jgi:hypothetical protein
MRFNYSLLSREHRVRSAGSGDVFTLVANDRRDTRFEIFGRFGWQLVAHVTSGYRKTS